MTVLLELDDLTPFAPDIDPTKAEAMIADAVAMASISAPCLQTPDSLTPIQAAAAKAIIRGAVLRWNETGAGALSAQAMGPFSVTLDTRQGRRTMFWPSEITELQKVCRGEGDGGAFSIDTAAQPMRSHAVFWDAGGSDVYYQFDRPPTGEDDVEPFDGGQL